MNKLTVLLVFASLFPVVFCSASDPKATIRELIEKNPTLLKHDKYNLLHSAKYVKGDNYLEILDKMDSYWRKDSSSSYHDLVCSFAGEYLKVKPAPENYMDAIVEIAKKGKECMGKYQREIQKPPEYIKWEQLNEAIDGVWRYLNFYKVHYGLGGGSYAEKEWGKVNKRIKEECNSKSKVVKGLS